MQQNELYHFGVKGMKWGVRKKSYVTVRQASKNAKAAMDKARKDSIAADKAKSKSGERVTYRQASKNASEAMKTARKESIAKDKAYNKRQREEAKATSGEKKALVVMAAIGTVTVAAAAARHAQVGMRVMDIMYPGLLPGQYNR